MSVNGVQTFTITNDGNQTITSLSISFNTPSGISHTANLSGIGGSSSVTGNSATASPSSFTPNTTKTFTVDYNYVSGGAEEYRYGQIYVTPTSSAGSGTQQTIQVAVYVDGDGSGFPDGNPGLPPGPPTIPQ